MKKKLVTNGAALVLLTLAALGSGYAQSKTLPATTNSSPATMDSPLQGTKLGGRRTHRSTGGRGHDPI
jgi:hypothetical protein